MAVREKVLIVGAGPVGLSAALFLAERGHMARIIEKRLAPSPYSKAFGVNARSLMLLRSSGVAARFLDHGRKLERLKVHRGDRVLAELRLDEVDDAYPFMCVQSQAESERMLAEAVEARGICIERGVEVSAIRHRQGVAEISLKSADGVEEVEADTALAADGASSVVRQTLGISFDGESYDRPWRLLDLRLSGPLDRDEGHIFLLDDGGMFVVRHENDVWRLLGNVPDLRAALPKGMQEGEVVWESEFTISNRIAGRFSVGPIFLAGDAAHIHSGIGARGMNLGIEDAYVFATLYDRGELDRYGALRRPVVEKVVAQIRRAMAVPRANTAPGRLVRAAPFLVSAVMSLVRRPVQRWVLGLDHDLGL